ncbi:hypothetical protein ABT330_19040 [Streptomyces sp. NPDC000658]|uniref:hypothetical protein n=1 Tax=Streptomyces sp. NPDC000658 TaxID=3154266 RepID=UPI00331F4407
MTLLDGSATAPSVLDQVRWKGGAEALREAQGRHGSGVAGMTATKAPTAGSGGGRRFRRQRFAPTDAGFAEPHDAKVQRATIDPAVLNRGPAS